MIICCDYSAGLVLLQLLGEFVGISSVCILGPCYASERLCDLVCLHCQVRFTWYSYVTTISDVVAAYCIQSISVKVLMEIVRLLRTLTLCNIVHQSVYLGVRLLLCLCL